MSDFPLPPLLAELAGQRPTRLNDGISGTDIKRIMKGDWHDLYLEKTGQVEPDPLLELPPLIGKYLAPLHMAWFEWQTGRMVGAQEQVSSAKPEVCIYCKGFTPYVTLDGRVFDPDFPDQAIPWEAKIVNGFMQRDALIEREYPQLQWQMLCEQTTRLELSVLYLNSRWESMIVERDEGAITAMIEQANAFWQHITDGTLPQDQVIEKVAPVKELVDMRGLAEWVDFERVWLDTRQPAKKFKDADAKLKKLIPKDAKTGFGMKLNFTRNKAGAVTLLPMTKDDRERLQGETK